MGGKWADLTANRVSRRQAVKSCVWRLRRSAARTVKQCQATAGAQRTTGVSQRSQVQILPPLPKPQVSKGSPSFTREKNYAGLGEKSTRSSIASTFSHQVRARRRSTGLGSARAPDGHERTCPSCYRTGAGIDDVGAGCPSGCPCPDDPRPVARDSHPRGAGGELYRIHRRTLATEEVTEHDDIPVTTVARTIGDCLRAGTDPYQLRLAVDQAEQAALVRRAAAAALRLLIDERGSVDPGRPA